MKRLFFTLLVTLTATVASWAATKYQINVAGVEVTSDNASNVTGGDIKSGTVTFNNSTKTLTLTNVTITRTSSGDYAVHNRSYDNLKIVLAGTCTFTTKANTLHLQKTTTVQVTGTTTLKSTENSGVYSDGVAVTVGGSGTLNVTSAANKYAFEGKGSTSSSTLTMSGAYITANGARGALYNWASVSFPSGAGSGRLTLKATGNSSYPVAWNLGAFSGVIAYPDAASYNSSSKAIVNSSGSKIYATDIVIVDSSVDLPLISTYFPDANFRAYMRGLYSKGYMTQSEVSGLTSLSPYGRSIASLKGIENFTNLTSLYCYNNALTSLDMTKNTKLQYLFCYDNTSLSSINVTGCTALKQVSCYNTAITSLDLSDRTALTYLHCGNCKSLTRLYCNGCALTSLTVSGCTALQTLWCYDNAGLSVISGLADCKAVTNLQCGNCAITDLSACNNMTNLVTLAAGGNKLTSLTVTGKTKLAYLDVSKNTSLTSLTCNNNALTTLNVTGCTALTDLICNVNVGLTAITGLANCTAMAYLNCEDCAITNLSVCNSMANLTELNCYGNKLTSLTLTNKSKLTYVSLANNTSLTSANIYNNPVLATLHTTSCTALKTLNCYNNALSHLDVTYCTALNTLNCYNNKNLPYIYSLADCKAITSLDCHDCAITDLSACNSMTNLATLYCQNNKLTSLRLVYKDKLTTVNASGNTSMTKAEIYSNDALATLNISGCTALKTLECNNNALTSLNVTGNTALEKLECILNRLTSLNVQGCSALTLLNCTKNVLISLNVQGCSALTALGASYNRLTSLNVQGCSALNEIWCYVNQFTESGMTTLVNSLPSRSATNPGVLKVLGTSDDTNYTEGNVFTAAHLNAAKAKHWTPKEHKNGDWAEIMAALPGDVDGNGEVSIADVTMLIDLLLAGGTAPDGADVDGDGNVSIGDVTLLIDKLLGGN